MNKKLPNVYPVPIDKKINNNEEIFDSRLNEERTSPLTIKEINELFNAKDHVYKTKVKIRTTRGEKIVEIVGISRNDLLTLNGEHINIDSILEIKKV